MFLILLNLILVIILLIYFNSKKISRRIKLWRRTLNLDIHLPILHQLYADVNGFTLSQQARAEKDALEYVYGEIDFESFIAILSRFKPNKNTVFYDLGSGCGKAVIACAVVFNVQKSCGIELFQNLHQCAQEQLKRLSAMTIYKKQSKTIFFKHADFLNCSLQDANLVFINASAFFGDFWQKISLHLEQLPKGAVVLTTSKSLLSQVYKPLEVIPIQMSWGVVKLYAQEHV